MAQAVEHLLCKFKALELQKSTTMLGSTLKLMKDFHLMYIHKR
jgi:hypothetical protein